MSTRPLKFFCPAGLLALLFLSSNLSLNLFAAPVRVTTWNLQAANGASPDTDTNRIQAAATVLKKLNPDVILLQHVRDWQMCGQLADALKPATYNVLVCSALRDPHTGASTKQQVAILSKKKAYFSWSEAWQAGNQPTLPGGYAFVAIRVGKEKVGFFSVALDDSGPNTANTVTARETSIRQLLQQIDFVKQWVTNSAQAFVIAGAFNSGANDSDKSVRLLEAAGFANGFADLPPDQTITLPGQAGAAGTTVDYVFALDTGFAAHPRIESGTAAKHYPVTCDLDMALAQTAATHIARVETPPAKPQPAAQATVTPSISQPARPAEPAPPIQIAKAAAPPGAPWWLAGVAVAAFGLIIAVWLLTRRKPALASPTPTLITVSSESVGTVTASDAGRIVIAPQSGSAQPIIHVESPVTSQGQSEAWRQRALAAEQRADRAHTLIRGGVLPHLSEWLKQKLVRKLVSDRTELLATQQMAALKAIAVDERLAKIEFQIQQQNRAYEQRIEELLRELATAKEENRELIRAKIALVKAEMEAAQARMLQQKSEKSGQ
ncbi:MAG: hypothetical protein JWR19_4219 [Pedosphaera sp.]|nr:hypothetical protein [Pedosphaera sp.]